jgi:hypothetical protein
MNVNIITDRGSNFIKAFAQYEPIYCFAHRINNVLKICFFQQQKNKKKKQQTQLRTNDISAGTKPASTTVDSIDQEDLSSSSESDSSDLEQEEEQQNKLIECLPVVKPRPKKTSSTTTISQKISLDDIPPVAKLVLFVLKQAKKLVKYVKIVSI